MFELDCFEPVNLDDVKSVVANCFLDVLSEKVECSDIQDFLNRKKIAIHQFKQEDCQRSVIYDIFVEKGCVGDFIDELNERYPELQLEWVPETDDKLMQIAVECDMYANSKLMNIMSTVIYDVIKAA